MSRIIDESGNVYGRLSVIGKADSVKIGQHWECQCVCGKTVVVHGWALRAGHNTSCGCNKTNPAPRPQTTPRLRGLDIYLVWKGMKTRCLNPKHTYYKDYGGRGIKVCAHWHIFENFLSDMGARPVGAVIDRINNDGDYEPENCQWVTRQENSNNKRDTVMITHAGVTDTLRGWEQRTGISYIKLKARLKYGWSPEKMLNNNCDGRRTKCV